MHQFSDPSDPLFQAFRFCTCCPRACGENRLEGALGYCATDAGINVSRVCVHQGEEPVLVGKTGICNVFFSHCNLQCRFCQNFQISSNQASPLAMAPGPLQVVEEIEACLRQGIRCVGFVSPSHVLPQMKWLMRTIKAHGFLPVFVMNTNAYDRVEELAVLAGEIQVYLPDFKYMDSDLAKAWSGAADYPAVAQRALREMFRQKGAACPVDPEGVIQSGLIIRHLVLPGHIENTLECLRWIARELSPEVHVSLMAQYTPTLRVAADPAFGRCLTEAEYNRVVQELDQLGMENGWLQGLESAHHYCPDFQQDSPFEP